MSHNYIEYPFHAHRYGSGYASWSYPAPAPDRRQTTGDTLVAVRLSEGWLHSMFLGMTSYCGDFIGTVQQYCVHTDGSRHVVYLLHALASFNQRATSCSSSSLARRFYHHSFHGLRMCAMLSCGLSGAFLLFSNSATASPSPRAVR